MVIGRYDSKTITSYAALCRRPQGPAIVLMARAFIACVSKSDGNLTIWRMRRRFGLHQVVPSQRAVLAQAMRSRADETASMLTGDSAAGPAASGSPGSTNSDRI